MSKYSIKRYFERAKRKRMLRSLAALAKDPNEPKQSRISKVVDSLKELDKKIRDKTGESFPISSNYLEVLHQQSNRWSKRRFNEQVNDNYDAVSKFWDNVYKPTNNPRTYKDGHLSKEDIAYIGLLTHGDLNTVVNKPDTFIGTLFNSIEPDTAKLLSDFVLNRVVFRSLQPIWQGSNASERWFTIMKRARQITGKDRLSAYDVVNEVFEQNKSMLNNYIYMLIDETERYGWDSDSVSSIISAIINSTNTLNFSQMKK